MAKIINYNVGNPYRRINVTDPVTLTAAGTTEQKFISVLVPANTFGQDDLINIHTCFSKPTTSFTGTIRLRFNTTDTLSTATILGTAGWGLATIKTSNVYRRFAIVQANGTGNRTKGLSTVQGVNNDVNVNVSGGYTQAPGNFAINWTSDVYIMATYLSQAGSTEVITCNWLTIQKG